MWYSLLLLKPRATAAMPNPSKAIKRIPTNPPTTPPTMAAIRVGMLPALKVCVYVQKYNTYMRANY